MSTSTCRPRFGLLVRGELRKIARQRANWPLMALAVVFAVAAGLVLSTEVKPFHDSLHQDPAYWFHGVVVVTLGFIIPTVEGALLLIVSARLVGMEYSAGTIRAVLARGVGPVQLLVAKLAALGAYALAVSAGFLVLSVLFSLVMAAAQGGSLPHVVSILPGGEWRDLWVHVLSLSVSAVVCVLIGAAGAAVSRSLAAGLVVAVGFFPLDNSFLNGVLGAVWQGRLTAYELGPNLNALDETLGHLREGKFSRPRVPVDGTHSLVLIGVYCAFFLLAAVLATWRRRDVLE
jgi:ABC-type transport system involved in multi-copper enzyme maturation permease subunit